MTNIERWLTPEQWEDYVGLLGYAHVHSALDVSGIEKLVARLARRAELLKKREWTHQILPDEHGHKRHFYRCLECKSLKKDGHAPGCAVDAELVGLPRGG